MDYNNLMKLAIDYSDGIIQGSENIDPAVSEYIRESKAGFFCLSVPTSKKNVSEIDAFMRS